MTCQRRAALCVNPAIARPRTDLINLAVCRPCADEALALVLICEPLQESSGSTTSALYRAAA